MLRRHYCDVVDFDDYYRCSACGSVFYCSRKCQRKQFYLHKKECKQLKKLNFNQEPIELSTVLDQSDDSDYNKGYATNAFATVEIDSDDDSNSTAAVAPINSTNNDIGTSFDRNDVFQGYSEWPAQFNKSNKHTYSNSNDSLNDDDDVTYLDTNSSRQRSYSSDSTEVQTDVNTKAEYDSNCLDSDVNDLNQHDYENDNMAYNTDGSSEVASWNTTWSEDKNGSLYGGKECINNYNKVNSGINTNEWKDDDWKTAWGGLEDYNLDDDINNDLPALIPANDAIYYGNSNQLNLQQYGEICQPVKNESIKIRKPIINSFNDNSKAYDNSYTTRNKNQVTIDLHQINQSYLESSLSGQNTRTPPHSPSDLNSNDFLKELTAPNFVTPVKKVLDSLHEVQSLEENEKVQQIQEVLSGIVTDEQIRASLRFLNGGM